MLPGAPVELKSPSHSPSHSPRASYAATATAAAAAPHSAPVPVVSHVPPAEPASPDGGEPLPTMSNPMHGGDVTAPQPTHGRAATAGGADGSGSVGRGARVSPAPDALRPAPAGPTVGV